MKDNSHLIMQIQYSNIDQKQGLVDDFAVDVYLVEKLRANDAGSVVFGDRNSALAPIPKGFIKVSYETMCPTECTKDLPYDLTVFNSVLSMVRCLL